MRVEFGKKKTELVLSFLCLFLLVGLFSDYYSYYYSLFSMVLVLQHGIIAHGFTSHISKQEVFLLL